MQIYIRKKKNAFVDYNMVLFLGNTYMKTYIHIIHKIELQNKRATIKRQEGERERVEKTLFQASSHDHYQRTTWPHGVC